MYNNVDDTTLVVVVDGPGIRHEVAAKLNRDRSSFTRWCRMWDVKINVCKTKTMVVRRSRSLLPHHPVLRVGGGAIRDPLID